MAGTLPTSEEELQTAIAEATKGLRAELTSERDKRGEFEKQMKETAAALADIKAEKEKTIAEAAQKDLEAKGEYEKAQVKFQETYTRKLAELTEQLAVKDAKIEQLMIDDKILALAGNAIEGKERQVVTLMKTEYKFSVKDGAVQVNTTDGKPLLDDKGQAMTVEGAYTKFMGENPHLVKPGTTTGGPGIRTTLPVIKQTGGDNLDVRISEAVKNQRENPSPVNRQLVIKLKAQKQSLEGPHSQLQSSQKVGG